MNETQKGFKKENIKKLFKWDGWSELAWIMLFVFLALSIWGYRQDQKVCREILSNPCEYCYAWQQNQQSQPGSFFPFDLDSNEFQLVINSTNVSLG